MSSEFTERCERLGAHPTFASAHEFAQVIAAEDDKLAALMAAIGLKKQ